MPGLRSLRAIHSAVSGLPIWLFTLIFFFNDTATTEIYTLSLHDALPIFLLFLVQSYYAGFGNMDYTLERHFKYAESIQFVKKNRGLAIGNGIVFMLVLLIPVVGIILVLPLSVTAASTETLRVLENQKTTQRVSNIL